MRVLIVGWDGATWQLLDPWVKEGRLPNLKRLMERGSHGVLRSTIPPITPTAWTTFLTGRNPGSHGVLYFKSQSGNQYGRGAVVNATAVRGPTLWDILGSHGRKIGSIGVPLTYPPRPVPGFLLTCFYTPPGSKSYAYPPALAERFPDYEPDVTWRIKSREGQPEYEAQAQKFLEELERVAAKRTAVTRALVREEPWDCLAVVYMETDRIQHFFWGHFRPPPDAVRTDVSDRLTERAVKVYEALDRNLGDLLADAEAAAGGADRLTVIMLSDHGFGPRPVKTVNVNRWLRDEGYFAVKRFWRVRKAVLANMPSRFQEGLGIDDDEDLMLRSVVWSRTRAWCETFEYGTAAFRINVRGRYPEGSVEAGEPYEALRTELKAKLEALQDPEGGKRVFRRVMLREDVYRGVAAEQGPDLGGILERGYDLPRKLGRDLRARSLTTDAGEHARSGSHEPEGIYVLAGPTVRAAGRAPEASIADIAPTALFALGLPAPAEMDGRPLADHFDERKLAAARTGPAASKAEDAPPLASAGAAAPAAPVPDSGWESPEDEKLIEERLRSLGYL